MLSLIKRFFGKKANKSYSAKEYAEELLRNSVARMDVSHRLDEAFKQASAVNSLPAMQAIYDANSAVMDVMVDRNLEGMALEKIGEDEKAAELYEMNINDRFDGSHPYKRLVIFYKYRQSEQDVLRIANAYLQYVTSGSDKFREKCKKIVFEQQNQNANRLIK